MNDIEHPVYQGAMPRSAEVRPVELPRLAGVAGRGEDLDRAVEVVDKVVEHYAKVHDFGLRQEAMARREGVRRDAEAELDRRAALPWGSEGSLFRADGSRNEDELQRLQEKYRKRYEEARGGDFMLAESRMRDDEEAVRMEAGLVGRVEGYPELVRIRAARAAFEENFGRAVAEGRYGDALGIAGDAKDAGIVSWRGYLGKVLGAGRSRACGGGCGGNGQADVRIGNQHFSDGASAIMGAQVVKEGGEVAEEVQPLEPSKGPVATTLGEVLRAGEAGEAVGNGEALTMARGGLEEGAPLPQGGNELTSSALRNEDSGVERFQELGDYGPVFISMPSSDFGIFANNMIWEPLSQRPVEGEDGRIRYEVDAHAPESVQRVQAQANANGELGKDAVTGAVVDMTLSQVLEDPTATPEQLLKPYEGSGWFEALGDGDAEVGKVRMHALVADCVERGRNGTAGVNNKTVEMMVESRLAETDVGAGEEWFEMEGLNPGKGKDKRWKKPSDEAEHARWMSLFNVYKKYRSQYNPGATGEADKDEFASQAQGFWDWYMRSGGPHERMRKAYMGAARDWYQAEVRGALLDATVNDRGSIKYAQDGAGGVSYVGEVSVIKGALGKSLPKDMGVDALLQEQERREDEEGRRAAAYAQKAQKSYQLLKGAKEQEAQRSQEAKEEAKERERAEKEAERKREKAEAAEEKRREKEAELRLRKARGQLRSEKWSWNRVDCGFKETKCAWVPEGEWERMQRELGHDGSQIPYIVVGGQEFLVVGPHDGRRCSYGGKTYNVVSPTKAAVQGLLLNTPAVQSLQKKPNFRKGEKWMLNGEFSYSYKFKDYKN